MEAVVSARIYGQLDDETLAKAGKTDLSKYAVRAGAPLAPDFFV